MRKTEGTKTTLCGAISMVSKHAANITSNHTAKRRNLHLECEAICTDRPSAGRSRRSMNYCTRFDVPAEARLKRINP
jgi:hypothetical protein